MADEDLRSLQRKASEGDPEARVRYLRHLCRKNGHQWVHYKGGDHLCQVCGEQSPDDPREAGNQTLYLDIPSVTWPELVAKSLDPTNPLGLDAVTDEPEHDFDDMLPPV